MITWPHALVQNITVAQVSSGGEFFSHFMTDNKERGERERERERERGESGWVARDKIHSNSSPMIYFRQLGPMS
jgi:hypothetical protein